MRAEAERTLEVFRRTVRNATGVRGRQHRERHVDEDDDCAIATAHQKCGEGPVVIRATLSPRRAVTSSRSLAADRSGARDSRSSASFVPASRRSRSATIA